MTYWSNSPSCIPWRGGYSVPAAALPASPGTQTPRVPSARRKRSFAARRLRNVRQARDYASICHRSHAARGRRTLRYHHGSPYGGRVRVRKRRRKINPRPSRRLRCDLARNPSSRLDRNSPRSILSFPVSSSVPLPKNKRWRRQDKERQQLTGASEPRMIVHQSSVAKNSRES